MQALSALKTRLLDLGIRGKLVPQLDGECEVKPTENTGDQVPFDIPQKWKWKKLKAVCFDFLVPMRDKPKFTDDPEGVDWCRIEDIQGKYLNGSLTGRRVSKSTIADMNLKIDPIGTVISACSASIGAAAIVTKPCCTNQTFIGLVPNEEEVYKEYLYYFLLAIEKHLWEIGSGTTIKYISRKKYENLLIPVPPLEEQARIVAKLESLSAIKGQLVPQLDEEHEVEQIGKAPKEVPFEIPEKWKWVTLNSLSKRIHYGYTAAAAASGRVHLLRITDVKDGAVDWNDVPYCDVSQEDVGKFKLFLGDILIARTGGTIGKSFLVESPVPDSVFASYLIRAIPDLSAVLPRYLMYFLRSPTYWAQLESSSRGTGQPNVNAKSLGLLKIPLPPLEEQKRIVEKLDKLMLEIQKLK